MKILQKLHIFIYENFIIIYLYLLNIEYACEILACVAYLFLYFSWIIFFLITEEMIFPGGNVSI